MSLPDTSGRTPGGVHRGPRLGTWGAVLAVCLVAGWMGFQAGRPFIMARHMRSDNADLEARINAARLDNQRLRRAERLLSTDQGLEREARRLGYVRPGEVALVVPVGPKR